MSEVLREELLEHLRLVEEQISREAPGCLRPAQFLPVEPANKGAGSSQASHRSARRRRGRCGVSEEQDLCEELLAKIAELDELADELRRRRGEISTEIAALDREVAQLPIFSAPLHRPRLLPLPTYNVTR